MSEFDKSAFYREIRGKLFGPTLDDAEVKGCEAVLDALVGLPLAHAAYCLATAYHETNGTMLPVKEAYWVPNAEQWRKTHLRYWPYYGRGYPQLTWEDNYRKADKELGLGGKLVANPDLAMEPSIAAQIMRRGMVEGWFTRKKLSTYLPAAGPASIVQFEKARPIINATDRAHLVATYAVIFQGALQAGSWA